MSKHLKFPGEAPASPGYCEVVQPDSPRAEALRLFHGSIFGLIGGHGMPALGLSSDNPDGTRPYKNLWKDEGSAHLDA